MQFCLDDLKVFTDFLNGVKYGRCTVEVQHEKVGDNFVPVYIFRIDMRLEDLEEFRHNFEKFKFDNSSKISMYYFDTTGFDVGPYFGSLGGAYFTLKWIGR